MIQKISHVWYITYTWELFLFLVVLYVYFFQLFKYSYGVLVFILSRRNGIIILCDDIIYTIDIILKG